MHYLTEMSMDELQRNFQAAHEHLTKVFSKYPKPDHVDGCPCCIDESDYKSLKEGDLSRYLWDALYVWGGENDFKHYLPKLIEYVYIDKEDDTFHIVNKIKYVENWKEDEIETIAEWYSAYAQWEYVGNLKAGIQKLNIDVQNWLKGRTEVLNCVFPFVPFTDLPWEDEVTPFLSQALIEKFTELLEVWPCSESDFIAYASCLANGGRLISRSPGAFQDKLLEWNEKNKQKIEESFEKTTDPRLKKLFREALQSYDAIAKENECEDSRMIVDKTPSVIIDMIAEAHKYLGKEENEIIRIKNELKLINLRKSRLHDLLSKANRGRISQEEIADVAKSIEEFQESADVNELSLLLKILAASVKYELGEPGISQYKHLMEKYLVYPRHPEISAQALSILCRDWNLTSAYIDYIKSCLKKIDLNSEAAVNMCAINLAGTYTRSTGDKECLKYLIMIFENRKEMEHMRWLAYKAIATWYGIDGVRDDVLSKDYLIDKVMIAEAYKHIGND